MKVSFVIPCYKSKSSSALVVEEVRKFVEDRFEYNFVLVDDGSDDGTWEKLLKIKEDNSGMKIIKLKKNMGESYAVLTGLKNCNGDYAITLDDDSRHPVDAIMLLVDTIFEGNFDIVYGYYRENYRSFFRSFCSKVNNEIANKVLQKKTCVNISGFKIFSQSLIQKLSYYNAPTIQIDGLIYSLSKSVGAVEVKCRENESRYNLKKLFQQLCSMIASSPFLNTFLGHCIFFVLQICTLLLVSLSSEENYFLTVLVFLMPIQIFIITVYLYKLRLYLNKPFDTIEEIQTNNYT